jgi:hypothetical protein
MTRHNDKPVTNTTMISASVSAQQEPYPGLKNSISARFSAASPWFLVSFATTPRKFQTALFRSTQEFAHHNSAAPASFAQPCHNTNDSRVLAWMMLNPH